MIDALKHSTAYNYITWSKAEIMQIYAKLDNDAPNMGHDNKGPYQFKIKYMGDTSVVEKIQKFDSKDIAPFDTKTKGDEWRNNLKQGDMVDILDKDNKWVNATVIKEANPK